MKKAVRLFIIFSILGLNGNASEFWRKDLKVTFDLINKSLDQGYYFATIPFLKESLAIIPKPDKDVDRALDKIINIVGIDQFQFLPLELLKKSNSHYFKYLSAKNQYESKKYKTALNLLKVIRSTHPIAAHASYLEGMIKMIEKRRSSANKSFDLCIERGNKQRNKFKENEIQYEYYTYLIDTCEISKARNYFKSKDFKSALKVYDTIPMTSYMFPSLLIETGWLHYKVKDYNGSIGKLLSYRAPYLENYFYPESEVLLALNFMNLCHWEEVQDVLKYFDKRYYKKAIKLINFLNKGLTEKQYLQMTLSESNILREYDFVRQAMGKIRNTPNFIFKSNQFHLGVKELKKIRREKNNNPLNGLYYNNTKRELHIKSTALGYDIKRQLYKIANEIIKTSQLLSLINIEMHGERRQLLLKNKKLTKDKRENIELIRTSSNVNWKFVEEFWLDEIGSFVWQERSRCSK